MHVERHFLREEINIHYMRFKKPVQHTCNIIDCQFFAAIIYETKKSCEVNFSSEGHGLPNQVHYTHCK